MSPLLILHRTCSSMHCDMKPQTRQVYSREYSSFACAIKFQFGCISIEGGARAFELNLSGAALGRLLPPPSATNESQFLLTLPQRQQCKPFLFSPSLPLSLLRTFCTSFFLIICTQRSHPPRAGNSCFDVPPLSHCYPQQQ